MSLILTVHNPLLSHPVSRPPVISSQPKLPVKPARSRAQRKHAWLRRLLLTVTCAALMGAFDGKRLHADQDDAKPKPTATSLHDQLFAKLIAQAKAAADPEQDLRLASLMMQVAEQSKGLPSLLGETCASAYDLASAHKQGRDLALKAARLRLRFQPATRADSLARVVRILEANFADAPGEGRVDIGKQLALELALLGEARLAMSQAEPAVLAFRRASLIATAVGSELGSRIPPRQALAERMQEAFSRIARGKERLGINPRDRVALLDVIRAAVVELDRPNLALPFRKYADSKTAALLGLAATEIPQLTKQQMLELGAWYRDLATKTRSAGKANALRRALSLHQAYLRVHKLFDTDHRRATLIVTRLKEDLAEFKDDDGTPIQRPLPAEPIGEAPATRGSE